MASITQSLQNSAIALAAITHPNSIEGTPVSVATALLCTVNMWHALVEATANTNPGKFRIFASSHASDNDSWRHLMDITVSSASAVTEALTATEPAGEKVLAVASVTGFAAADNIYVINTTIGSSEWHTIDKVVAATSIDIMIGLANEQTAAASDLWSDAEQFSITIDCKTFSRIRVDFSHEGATGADCHVKAEVDIASSIG